MWIVCNSIKKSPIMKRFADFIRHPISLKIQMCLFTSFQITSSDYSKQQFHSIKLSAKLLTLRNSIIK